jgi:hypothetical protein
MEPERPRSKLDESSIQRFLQALERFEQTGECTVPCDRCGKAIQFRWNGPYAIEHDCECGKYSGTIRL